MNKIVNLKTEDIIQVEDKNFHYEYIVQENDDGIIFIQTLKTRMPKPITPRNPREPRISKLDLILKRLDTVDTFITEQRKFNAKVDSFIVKQEEFNQKVDLRIGALENKLSNIIEKNNLKV